MTRVRQPHTVAVCACGVVSLVVACGPSETGGELVSFHAYASGLETAEAPLDFDAGNGFHVRLTQARMHIGALYWRLGQANPGSANASCVGDTTYGLQVSGPVDVDVLSTDPQEFSVLGAATTDLDQSAEVWLTTGDIDDVGAAGPVVTVTGVATKAGGSYPFSGSVSIGANHLIPPSSPATPGENPICKQRIVAPIPLSIQPAVGGDMMLRIDPRPWFDGVDFTALVPGDDGITRQIPDTSSGAGADVASGRSFFSAITSSSDEIYRFSWVTP